MFLRLYCVSSLLACLSGVACVQIVGRLYAGSVRTVRFVRYALSIANELNWTKLLTAATAYKTFPDVFTRSQVEEGTKAKNVQTDY